MKLCEIVRAEKTAPDALTTAVSIARKIAKVPAVVGVCDGFVGNRMLAQRGKQSEKLLFEGALPQQVDAVVTKFGMPMGPFAMGRSGRPRYRLALAQGPRHQVGNRRRAVRSRPLRPEDRQGLLQV